MYSQNKFAIMGKGFGHLYYMRNIVTFRVSSYEQRAFPNFFKESMINVFNEFKTHAPAIIPPMAIAYLTVKWGEAEHERRTRKDPNLYKDIE